ncbi:MAG: gluconokinase [Actinobacteria bacterium]|nr:gluconokinase [Actinomycetota bacterium]
MTVAGPLPQRRPRLVVMGVAGSGKTTVGRALATALDLGFVDADDLHPAANVALMAAGLPLDEADRAPWLVAVTEVLADDDGLVLACSALRRSHRDVLRGAGPVEFVFLDVDLAEAVARAANRPDHFMGPAMIPSQFATLERPDATEDDVMTVDASRPEPEVVAAIVQLVSRRRGWP